jgi:hypothetical protein
MEPLVRMKILGPMSRLRTTLLPAGRSRKLSVEYLQIVHGWSPAMEG